MYTWSSCYCILVMQVHTYIHDSSNHNLKHFSQKANSAVSQAGHTSGTIHSCGARGIDGAKQQMGESVSSSALSCGGDEEYIWRETRHWQQPFFARFPKYLAWWAHSTRLVMELTGVDLNETSFFLFFFLFFSSSDNWDVGLILHSTPVGHQNDEQFVDVGGCVSYSVLIPVLCVVIL